MKTFIVEVEAMLPGLGWLEIEAADEEEALKIASKMEIENLQMLDFEMQGGNSVEADWFKRARVVSGGTRTKEGCPA